MFSRRLKILIVCSKNKWRSPTAENIYRGDSRVEIRSAGTSQKATHIISIKDIEWAELILCMEVNQKDFIENKFKNIKIPPLKVLEISDEYVYMDPVLVNIMKDAIEDVLLDFVELN